VQVLDWHLRIALPVDQEHRRRGLADEAARLGLADKVVPAGELLGKALGDAAVWAQGPTEAYGAAKRALNDGWGRSLAGGLDVERAAFEDCF